MTWTMHRPLQAHATVETEEPPAVFSTVIEEPPAPKAPAKRPQTAAYPPPRDGWERVHGRTGGWYYRKVR
jgi:hypothetical protein